MDQAAELPPIEETDSAPDSAVELLDLNKQQRNLLLLRPLFQLELNKHSIGTESGGAVPLFKDLDTHYLVLTALDQMMEGTTIHMGCTPAEVIDGLMAVASVMKPGLTSSQARRVAEAILDTLDKQGQCVSRVCLRLLRWTCSSDENRPLPASQLRAGP